MTKQFYNNTISVQPAGLNYKKRRKKANDASRIFVLPKFFYFFIFLIILGGVLFFSGEAMAANCGDTDSDGVTDTTCNCGDTVVGASGYTYELTSDLICTGHGLLFGTSTITIDGNGYTITGDGDSSDYGIYNNGFDYATTTNITITNFGIGIYYQGANYGAIANSTANSNSYHGIYLSSSSSNNTLTNNTTNSNSSYGILLSSSSNNTLTNNTANSNSYHGIYLSSSSNNTLTNNTANDNSNYGIYLSSSSNNTLTNNTMSNNTYNLYIIGQYNNTIDTTNLVESKPVYYLYDQHGTAENPLVYDENEGDIGMFWAINCDYIEVKNAVLSDNNYYGIYFNNVSSSTIENINASNYRYGIYLSFSSNNTLTNNTANDNSNYGILLSSSSNNTLTNNTTNSNHRYGIYLSSSSNNTLTNNTVNSNYGILLSSSSNNTLTNNTVNSNHRYGIYLSSSSNNTLTNNTISNNINDIYDDGDDNDYSQNQFLHNANNKMLTWTEIDRVKNINDTVNFSFSMFNPNGTACSDCSYSVAVYPNETISTDKSGNNVTSTFTFTQNGTYSLEIQITDSNNNTTKRRFVFLVGNTDSKTIRYYLRDANPTHRQPCNPSPHADAKALLLTPPTEEEWWECSFWIQNSPDELPPYALGNLESIDIHSWYKTNADGYIGIQRYATYDIDVDISQNVSASTDYTENDLTFSDINWIMDYQKHWYWLSLKLKGFVPHWRSTPSQPSYADFTYFYAISPAIKSNSNENIIILSVTATSSVSSIILENTATSATSTNLVLTNFNSPFLNATSTITSEGTTTIATGNISTSAPLTLNSVKMDVSPSSGSIGIIIDNWQTSETYYKKWTESATGTLSVEHTIGDLKPNTYYTVKVDGSIYETHKSNSSGEITFTYNGGYSDHIFEVEEDTTPPANVGAPSFGTITTSSIEIIKPITVTEEGSELYQWQARRNGDTELGFNSTSTTSIIDSSLSENTLYTYDVQFKDNAGNISDYGTSTTKYTLADTPTNLIASSVNTDSITLFVDSFPNDTSGSSGYYFKNTTTGANSGWIQTNSWQDTGLSCGTLYTYIVKYRNGDGVETDTISLTQSTSNCGGGLPSATYNPPSAPAPSPENPQGGFKILINQGDEYTNTREVTLKFFASSDTKRMAISNNPEFKGLGATGQIPYQSSYSWDICQGQKECPDGSYTVYVKFFTQWGQASEAVSDSIILKTEVKEKKIIPEAKPKVSDEKEKLTTPSEKEKLTTPSGIVSGKPIKAKTIVITQNLTLGSQNNEVVELQNKLKQLGYFPKDVSPTGYFGLITKQAVMKYQRSIGIYPCGIVGPRTRKALNNQEFITNKDYQFTQDLKYNDTGEEVKQLQIRLKDQNFFPYWVKATGWFGPITEKAVKLFQGFYNIVQTGVIDKLTREILNR